MKFDGLTLRKIYSVSERTGRHLSQKCNVITVAHFCLARFVCAYQVNGYITNGYLFDEDTFILSDCVDLDLLPF